MAKILRGAPVAEAMTEALKPRAEALRARGVAAKLAILRVGERADDMSYEQAAVKRCAAVGIEVESVALPLSVTQSELTAAIERLNNDAGVHGVLMFLPLPKTLDEKAACAALKPSKDVDGITAGSLAKVYSGSGEGYSPCTAQSVMELLRYYGVDVSGKRAAVIGRSLVIGRPVSMLLMAANATVTICQSGTVDLPSVTREADIVVAALGRGESIGAEYFSPGQTVIDVGVNYSEAKRKLVGDVDFEGAERRVKAISPIPGGVGSVTAAVLCAHVLEAAEKGTPK